MAPLYKLITVVLTVATLGVTASCQSTTSGGAVGANRQQFLLVSSGQLNQMAARAYNQLLAESAKKGALNT
ncbi:MAG: M48 family peptidase, partial [Burkholderiales bacterium]